MTIFLNLRKKKTLLKQQFEEGEILCFYIYSIFSWYHSYFVFFFSGIILKKREKPSHLLSLKFFSSESETYLYPINHLFRSLLATSRLCHHTSKISRNNKAILSSPLDSSLLAPDTAQWPTSKSNEEDSASVIERQRASLYPWHWFQNFGLDFPFITYVFLLINIYILFFAFYFMIFL